MQLAYSRWGNTRNAKKILFLHGMGGTGALWRPIAANLEDDFEILSPDQRGHGKSQIPAVAGGRGAPTYTPLDYGRDIIETVEALAFAPCWIVGHSMGVRTAVATAYLKPEIVQGLVLVDLGFSGVAGGGLGDGLAHFLKDLPMYFASRSDARAYMDAHAPDRSIGQYLLAVTVGTPEGGVTFPFDRAALIETIRSARDSSVREWLKKLGQQSMRVLVLRGALSEVWSKGEFERERAELAPYPSILFEEFEGTGHGLPFEKRAAFVQRIRDFVQR